jgi:Rieske 2Fe-2S family protein
MDLRDGARTMSLDGSTPVPVLPGLGRDLAQQVLYIDLFPGLLLSLHPDYVLTHRLEPLAAGRTSVECQWLFAPEAVARADFDPGYAVDFWDVTNAQDWTACESVQRGVASRGYRPGLLSTQEASLHRFLELVATGYLRDAAPV